MKLTRADMLRLAGGGGIAAALAGASGVGRVHAQTALRPGGTLQDIMTGPAPSGDVLLTSGYSQPGLGAARYRRVAQVPDHAGHVTDQAGAVWELNEPIPTPEMFGAIGDGQADDHDALRRADTMGRLKLSEGQQYRVSRNLRLASDLRVESAARIVQSGDRLRITGAVFSNDGSAFHTGGALIIDSIGLRIGTQGDFQSVQEAVDSLPRRLWQLCRLELAPGETFDEDILVAGFTSATMAHGRADWVESARVVVQTARDTEGPLARIRSLTALSCVAPVHVSRLSVTGHGTRDNERAALAAYQSRMVIFTNNTFEDSTGADKGLLSYSAFVRSGRNRFGDARIGTAFTVKGLGVLHDDGRNTGTLQERVADTMNGHILLSRLSELSTAADTEKVRTLYADARGQKRGTVTDAETGMLFGPVSLAAAPAFEQTGLTHPDFLEIDGDVRATPQGLSFRIGAEGGQASATLVRRPMLGAGTWQEAIRTARFAVDIDTLDPQAVFECVIGAPDAPRIGLRITDGLLFGLVSDGTREATVSLARAVGGPQGLQAGFIAHPDVVEFALTREVAAVLRHPLPQGSMARPDGATPVVSYSLRAPGAAQVWLTDQSIRFSARRET